MDEGDLKNGGDDSSCSSVLMSADNPDCQVQLPVEIMSRDLPMTEDILMETTENNDVMELEKSSSNILQMAFLLKSEIEILDRHFSSSSQLQQSVAFPEEGDDRVFDESEQVRNSPSSSREPSKLHHFGEKNLDHSIGAIKRRSLPIFVGESGYTVDCMMDTVEPSFGVERSVSASAFGDEEELELEMKQAADINRRMFEEDRISDSSLTLAANQSLDMSQSLTDRCCKMAELAVSSDDLCSDRFSRKRTWTVFSSVAPQYNSPKVTSTSFRPSPLIFESSVSPFNDRKTLARTTVDVDRLHNAKSVQRFRVVEEIVETERKYCTCLWILINHFSESLSASELLSEKDISIIFPSCLRRIYTHHCEFFDQLENRLVNWSESSTVADLFSDLFEADDEHSQCGLFMQYQAFVDAFPAALLRIRKLCQRNTELHKFVKDLESQGCCEGLDVGAYLLTPIQRIPRYVLLLKQLVRCTDDAHPDFILVDSCLLKLGEFLSRLNESIKQSMELVSGNTQRRRRQFNLAGISFGGSKSTNTEGRHRWSFRHKKNPSPPNANRVSPDLPFLGLLKQKKQNGSKDKIALSEQCLRTSLPDRKDPLPEDQLLTSTPHCFCTQSASSCPNYVFPKQEPGTKFTEDAMNNVFSSPNIPSEDKTSKVVQGNGFRDLSLRVQVNRKAFLSKFRKRANQGSSSSGLSSNSTKPDVCMMVDVNSCDTNEESIYTSSSIFPPKKLRRTDGSPKPESNQTAEVKRKPSMRDALKNFFVKKGSGKSKICSQSRASNSRMNC